MFNSISLRSFNGFSLSAVALTTALQLGRGRQAALKVNGVALNMGFSRYTVSATRVS